MDELNEEVLDQGAQSQGPKEAPEGVKIMAILSIIGSSLWGFLCVIALFWLLAAADALGKYLPSDANGIFALVIIFILIMIGTNVGGIIAAVKMRNGNKKAFILYAVCTAIWALFMIMGGIGNSNSGQNSSLNWLSAVASIGFIIGFGVQMKNMPD